jgi:hypothetical protein
MLTELRGHSGHGTENQPGHRRRHTERDRPRNLESRRQQCHGDAQPDHDIRDGDGEQRCRGGRERSDGQCPQQLEPARFLLGAGVPNDEQDAHDRHGHEHGQTQFVRGHRTEGVIVGAVGRAGHQHGRGVLEQRRPGLPRRGVGIHRLETAHGRENGAGQRQGPHRDADSVEAQVEPEQCRDTCERFGGLGTVLGAGSEGGAHRVLSSSDSPVVAARACISSSRLSP